MLTCHRKSLDRFLGRNQFRMLGRVLDIGGKKVNRRGEFAPPYEKVSKWEFVNLDPDTNPDYHTSAEALPLCNNTIDTFIMCEVLEHLKDPEQALLEARRVLKPGGYGILTVPFLYAIHDDPVDYQRWSDMKLTTVLNEMGLGVVELCYFGGEFEVIHDLLFMSLFYSQKDRPYFSKLGRFVLQVLRKIYGESSGFNKFIHTGYGIVVRKEL